MDEFCQLSPPDESQIVPDKKAKRIKKSGGKSTTLERQLRWQSKHPHTHKQRRRDYMKKYRLWIKSAALSYDIE